jgi:hypothetical protein
LGWGDLAGDPVRIERDGHSARQLLTRGFRIKIATRQQPSPYLPSSGWSSTMVPPSEVLRQNVDCEAKSLGTHAWWSGALRADRQRAADRGILIQVIGV